MVFHSKVPDILLQRGAVAAGNFFGNGDFAVQLFFFLSGFILSYTYQGQIETSKQRRRFWEARYSRIWPLYLVSLLLATLVYHGTPPLPAAIATLLMVQAWNPFSPEMAGAWNFVCWTLSAEALFYALFPALQRWLERRSEPAQMGVLFSMLTLAVLGHTGEHGLLHSQPELLRYLPLALMRVPDFVIGVCLGNLYLRRLETEMLDVGHKAVRDHGAGFLTSGATIASILLLCHPKGWWTAFAAISFATLLWGLAVENSSLSRILASKPLLIGGQISFGMYLLQWPCKLFVYDQFDRHGMHDPVLHFIGDVIVLLLISTVGFYAVEDPARKHLRKFFALLERKT